LGAQSYDEGLAIAVDASGNAAVTGFTDFMPDHNFPTRNSLQPYQNNLDAFVAKLDPNGNVFYSSYFGGAGSDRGRGIAIDTAGDVYLVGETESRDLPLKNASRTVSLNGEAFITKITDSSPALPPPGGTKTFPSFRRTRDGQFVMEISIQPNRSVRVEGSTDLKSWTPLAGFSEGDGQFIFVDTEASSFRQRFYRLVNL
jgi:hypothetical protein